MTCADIINIVALIVVPIVAVLIGQHLQNRAQKRKDKMEIFKTLMIARNGWTVESVRALNVIDIIFVNDKKVRNAWRDLYDKYRVENPDNAHLEKIRQAQYKLIEEIVNSLGYKNKITWETIQNPYIPKGMVEAEQLQREFQNGQLAWAKAVESFTNQTSQSQEG
ncbi:hypothetical protein QVN96_14090 [Mediterraneibacter glycyrrhizinilyticus]|uniref:DUF6680 family protein n=1 Tax=Mediterraneibacter glycyrrhizinilyticus TaxID=342942 RepID=UPI0025AB51CF|nr:DUF6680 family protein [Mediterraneibacter glycyrrhizinilyticus]MDN0062512.1 hypothetical protein [Mediterraneibacter glycyrrhizinilyticus]